MTNPRQDRQKKVDVPLIVIAGLPYPVNKEVAKAVAVSANNPKVIEAGSNGHNRHLYDNDTVDTLLKAVCSYAIKQKNAQQTPRPNPQYLMLAYVPSEDEESLLSKFDYFVFPVSLDLLANYDKLGKQNRYNEIVTVKFVSNAINAAMIDFYTLKSRLSNSKANDAFLLPPKNFQLPKGERLEMLFLELRKNERPWCDTLGSELTSKSVTSDDLYNVPAGSRLKVFEDHRGLLYPQDTSKHGLVRPLAENCSISEMQQFLSSAFRFGVPLRNGFHHDVQRAGRDLRGEVFDCSRHGSVTITGTHANIYPDDYVRAQK